MQWQKDGIDIPGETNSTLEISSFTPFVHNGEYAVVVNSNDFGSVRSDPLTMNIESIVAPTLFSPIEINSTIANSSSIISANSLNQVAVSGQNAVEIYQIGSNGSFRLITTIFLPSQASSSSASKIVLGDEFLLVGGNVYSIGSRESDFEIIDTVPFFSGSLSPAVDGSYFAVPNDPGWNENPRTYKPLDYINIYRYEENMTVTFINSLAVPTATEVLGDISNDQRGIK